MPGALLPQDVMHERLVSAPSRWTTPGGRIEALDPVSMVHLDALAALAELASIADGPVLEVGPYTGGSTLALCLGLERGRPLITIEMGGATIHPRTPSADILADLRANLDRFGELDRVTIIEGLSDDPLVAAEVASALRGVPASLFVVDANGQLDDQLVALSPFLSPHCLLSIDDYLCVDGSAEGNAKAVAVQAWLAEAERSGALRGFGVFGDGTWMGQVNGPAGLAALRRRRRLFKPDSGHCALLSVALPIEPDGCDQPRRSTLSLLEDGHPLGPAHSAHAEIRTRGGGRFSHWVDTTANAIPRPRVAGLHPATLFLSASDNSDPRTNGRAYEAECAGVRIALTG